MPVDKSKYPADWKAISAFIRFERAGNRCECEGECGLHRTNPGPRRCIEVNRTQARFARGRIILTTAHLCLPEDHNGALCADETHLKAMCQRCHLRYDAALHARNAAETKRKQKEAHGQFPFEFMET